MSIAKSYNSKVSYGLFIPILILLLTALVTALIYVEISTIIIISIVLGLVILPMLLNTRYTITDDTLNVRCGFFINTNIAVASIRKIVATKSVLSAPALSLSNRIEVFYNKYDSVVISPANIAEFTAALKQINYDIVIEL